MKNSILILFAFSLFLTAEASANLACSIMDLGYKRYDTSLELTKSFNDYLVIISPDGKNWEYLQEHEGISCGHHFASLMLDGSDRNIYFSLARKLPAHCLTKNIVGIQPLTDPAKRSIKARATNFMPLSLDNNGGASILSAESVPYSGIKFRLLSDGDEDGLPDDSEFEKYGAWPGLYDTDRDGLSDGEEVSLGTKPFMADSDGDGITDADDPHPLVPEYDLSYSAWVAYWSDVSARFQIPGLPLTKANFSNKVQPFSNYLGVTAKFSPDSITLTNGASETNVIEVSFLCGGSVTGALYTSECFGLDHEKIQFLPEDVFPAAPEGTAVLPFIARCGEILRFKLFSSKEYEENGQIRIKTFSGTLPQTLPIGYVNALSASLELTSPPDSAEFSDSVSFSWNCADTTVTNYLLTITGPAFREYSLINESLTFTPAEKGRYLWLVTAQGANGPISSETRSFFVLDDDREKDSDGDGFSDNDERKEGFDPFDSSDVPMRLVPDLPPLGERGLFYFKQLDVSGGVRPLYWEMNGGSARGLSVNEKGLLFGVPLRSGSFSLRFSVKDQLGRVFDFSLPVSVSEKGTLDISPGLGGFLVK